MWSDAPLVPCQLNFEGPTFGRVSLARRSTDGGPSLVVAQSVVCGGVPCIGRGAIFADQETPGISGNKAVSIRRRSAPPRTLPIARVPPIAPTGSFAEVHLQQGIVRVQEEVRSAYEHSNLIQKSLAEAGEQGKRLLAESERLETRLAEARAELKSERCALDFAKEEEECSDVELESATLRAQIQRLKRSNESLEDALQEHELSTAASDESSSVSLPDHRSASEHDLAEARRRADALRTEVEEARRDFARRKEGRERECRLAELDLRDAQDRASSALVALDKHMDAARSRAEELSSEVGVERATKRERAAKNLEEIRCLRAELEIARGKLSQNQVHAQSDLTSPLPLEGDWVSRHVFSDHTSSSVSSMSVPGQALGQEVLASAVPSFDVSGQISTPQLPYEATELEVAPGAAGPEGMEPAPGRSSEGKTRRKLRRLRLERPASPSGSDRSSPSITLSSPSHLTHRHNTGGYTMGDVVGDTLLTVDYAMSWLGEALQAPQAIGETISTVDESLSWFEETPQGRESIGP